ncbi:HAD-IIA family hydrolase [Novosphingobium album (ex Liu et al. 2023)]|uniref:HAD-IIA family hydrolase n=1 Tax=Novosphingobium album (ex Liu et al. 2023) TaxID=3031130 RepID=A0ABT5WX45_9SPHN|nr:HAD-IIA family hydrolase [Novosphingobium album (ex Liu et al. 2023)]MDE8654478.1 HAD-IIA family hydrolase [Novosphingobium album (ex Liu et al. 2023)]
MSIEPSSARRAVLLNDHHVKPSATRRRADDDDAIAAGDHFILDLDGTLLRGGAATEGARDFLRAVEGRFALVSNNSRETGRSLSSRLRRVGFDIPADRIVLAGEEAVGFVAREYPGARCLVATSTVLRHCARRHGLVPVAEKADVVLLGRDTRWSYGKLALLANEVRRGAVLVAANPDLTHPGNDGLIVPETGSLLAAVEAAAGIAATHVIGKPAAMLFVAALERLGSSRAGTIVIGDNPLTDRAGASALGLRSLIVHADRQDGHPNLADLCDRLADTQ